MKKKILFLAPHLSTGGMPQFLLTRIETVKDSFDIYVVEYECISNDYTIQRDKIKSIVGDHFFTLGVNKLDLINIINENNVDLIHLENEAEGFDFSLMEILYSNNRKYKIIETCHNISFNPENKIFYPDAFSFCTPYHLDTFSEINRCKEVIQYPIVHTYFNKKEKKACQSVLGLDVSKKNVLSVGLWTKGKNQKEGLEIARNHPEIDFHFVGNQADNFKEYWEDLMIDLPENVKVWGERDDVCVFMKACDVFMFNSTYECMPLVLKEAIGHGMKIYAYNLTQYCGVFDGFISSNIDFVLSDNEFPLYSVTGTLNNFTMSQISLYKHVINSEIVPQPESKYVFIDNFVNNPYFEIIGRSDSDFKIQFLDEENLIVYDKTIRCNSWVKLNRQYYAKYRTKVWENDVLVYDKTLSLTDKKVMISLESSSLGDTLAWIPYCDEFQKKHNCKLIVSTYKNFLFKDQYPNISFISPSVVVPDLYAKYNIGWFYDENKEPILPNTIPLQQTATNILGLTFKEIKPKLNLPNFDYEYDNDNLKIVTIATNSTSMCKEWSKVYWQKTVDYLCKKGFTVFNVSKENDYDLKRVCSPDNYSIEETIWLINQSEFFIGLSSGLSWLAWALNKKVFMIANFSEKNHEFQENCIRITNESVCHGCWNNPNFKFDKGDWHWCPINKNLPKMFECHKSITSNMLIDLIKKESI